MKIESLQNQKVKYAFALRERRDREREKKTILEGYRELSRALEFGMKLEECFYCPEMFLGENEFFLLEKLKTAGTEITEVSPQVLRKLAYRDRPEGLIAIASMREHSLDKIQPVKNGLYIIAEAVEKPGNLGSILRSADAAGADALIVCDKCTDIYNPNVIRASTGALFTVPLAEASKEETALWLKNNNVKLLAASPHAEKFYTDVDMTGAVALMVGAEQYGLSDFWMRNADIQVQIPMLGKIDSLNVATAATIILYEAARQRKWVKKQ
ncbi:MAG: rRNA methyltransferase [Lentisphaerae bacterium GWF2_44_16]|nr:MAG: rRNA methyltransferase [Lentisphaerae bacterium GWF2_44_16]